MSGACEKGRPAGLLNAQTRFDWLLKEIDTELILLQEAIPLVAIDSDVWLLDSRQWIIIFWKCQILPRAWTPEMKLIYFDESKHEPKYPHYHIGGICIDESALQALENLIQSVAVDVFSTAELSRETEFHAKEIFHRKNNFKSWSFDRRIELISKFADILSRNDVDLIDIQVNCNLIRKDANADEIAFMFFCERVNDLVLAQQSIGMLIGDRESDIIAARYATTLSGYRARSTDFEYGRKISNLVDSVHFTHSHLSRFLQLADIYTWLLQFKNRNRESQSPRHQAIFSILSQEGVNLFPSKYKEWPKAIKR